MSPNARGRGVSAGSQPMRTAVHITWHGAQINFGDLTPYLTYDPSHPSASAPPSAPSPPPLRPLTHRPRSSLFPSIFHCSRGSSALDGPTKGGLMVSVIRKYYTALLLLVISAPWVDSGWGGGRGYMYHICLGAKYTSMWACNLKRFLLVLSQAAAKGNVF